ncbi:MAG: TonB C-terminal domain-containing protein [Spirochaetia bacterium]|nr:TonB C-terminal domain-containing protein [Spirochaetia bacterium]
MKFNKLFFDQLAYLPEPDRDGKRLVLSGFPVFFLFSIVVLAGFAQIRPFAFLSIPDFQPEGLLKEREEKIYPVLVEQDYKPKPLTEQYRALSDVSAEGTGGITLNPGFHTLTPFDRLDLGGGSRGGSQESSRNSSETRPGDGMQQGRASTTSNGEGPLGNDAAFRIPQNYRFQADFALRYDGAAQLSVARQELAGFRYFQHMIRQIRENFSPPGLNYAYRDNAGLVISEPIHPQTVQVLFLLDPQGNVRDVRKVSSAGQKAVDDSCVNALAGQNFGVPPPEVFSQGPIFGINFIFPPFGY